MEPELLQGSKVSAESDVDLTFEPAFGRTILTNVRAQHARGGCMIRYLRPFRFALPLVLLALPLHAQRSQSEGPTDIQVYVTYDNSRPAGEQLRVDLSNASGIPMTQAFTDSSGRALLQVGSQGGYIVKVSGLDIQDGASESFEVFYCPSHCTRQVFVRVKGKGDSAQSTATQSSGKPGKPSVTSAAELRVPQTARKTFDQGMTAWQKKDYQQAAEKFEKAVAEYPQYDTAYNNLGVMYAHLDQNDKAMAAFKRSVELNDKNADADRNLARMLMRQKDYPQAEELLKKALVGSAAGCCNLDHAGDRGDPGRQARRCSQRCAEGARAAARRICGRSLHRRRGTGREAPDTRRPSPSTPCT